MEPAPTRETAREAAFYEKLTGDRVRCTLCPHRCRLADGTLGACGVRVNHHGTLYSLVHDRLIASSTEPIEKKPLFHFLPGSLAYSIATVGCCLRCSFCQNWRISQWPMEHLPRHVDWADRGAPVASSSAFRSLQADVPGAGTAPERIVADALAAGARSIAYTFVEPTVFYELAYETATLARAGGLRNLFITCGYTSAAAVERLAGVLDAVNVDLKFFRESSYRRHSRGSLQSVLDAIEAYQVRGVWVEVTTLVIPGVNDSDAELRDMARFIRAVSPEVPWHLSRFFPAYRMRDRGPTPVATLRRARRIGLAEGLRYVYLGNVPDDSAEDTACHGCGRRLIERVGNVVRSNAVEGGRCPACGEAVAGILG